MRTLRLFALLAACTVALSGCRSSTEPGSLERFKLDGARHRWADAGVAHYAFNMRYAGAWFSGYSHVEVLGDSVIAVTPLDALPGPHFGATIPGLFTSIEEAMAMNSPVSVTYDAALGYPQRLDLPDPPGMADYGHSVLIDSFVRL